MPENDYIDWLVEESMLEVVKQLTTRYAGQGHLWQQPYAKSRPRDATSRASIWLAGYPAAIVTRDGESVLRTLGDATLWQTLAAIGIQGIHMGPMKQAGGLRGREYTPTVDGYFDRIGLDIDPLFGTKDEFVNVSRTAAAHNAIVIDDVVPAHTGKGADFRLAERCHADYAGLYHMVEIRKEDWPLLPAVPPGGDAVNLPAQTVDELMKRGYIVGRLQRTIFEEPGVKETDWSATDIVRGTDGVARRWVYLHYFKEGQPALNWLDPSFAAQRLVVGDALHSLDVMGARGLRLDANGFLGIEKRQGDTAWSEGHPLSLVGNQLIAGMVRKAGGFTFQELNLTVDDIAAMSQGGADLSYDFITRPAYHHALITGDTEFLRLMLRIMHNHKIDPAGLIHALQNHDELTLELVHFWRLHARDTYMFQDREWTGSELREHIREVMYERLTGENAPYNLRFVENGVACTTVSVITAALGIRDLDTLTEEQKQEIQRVHLLLCMYNAFQPGVFALSGWDLVGALPLAAEEVADRTEDGDTRWINRGAYDLVNMDPNASTSAAGLPKARALYGSLTDQLDQPDSFASQLRRLLAVRQAYRIHSCRQTEIPDVTNRGLLVMVHELPKNLGTQVTALNFGATAVDEVVTLTNVPDLTPGPVINMLTGTSEGDLSPTGQLTITLAPYEGKSLRIGGKPPADE